MTTGTSLSKNVNQVTTQGAVNIMKSSLIFKRRNQTRHALSSFGFAALLLCSPDLPASGSPTFSPRSSIPTPFSAEVWYFDSRSGERQKAADVIVTNTGTKIKRSAQPARGQAQETIIIENFETNKSWVSLPSERIFAPLPNNTQDDQSSDQKTAGLMSTQPCSMANRSTIPGTLLGHAEHEGDQVEVWQCVLEGYSVLQLFSPRWAIVVREILPNHQGSELRRLSTARYGTEFFQPNSEHAEVSLEELITGVPKLSEFDPQN